MAIRFGIQHRTTKRFLSAHPDMGQGHQESPDEAEAVAWGTRNEAELYRIDLEDFVNCWDVVPIEFASINDKPRTEADDE